MKTSTKLASPNASGSRLAISAALSSTLGRQAQVDFTRVRIDAPTVPGDEPEATTQRGHRGIVVPMSCGDHLDLGLKPKASDDLLERGPAIALTLMRPVDHEAKNKSDPAVDFVHHESDHRHRRLGVSTGRSIVDRQRDQPRIDLGLSEGLRIRRHEADLVVAKSKTDTGLLDGVCDASEMDFTHRQLRRRFELTRVRRLAKPAVALRVQRRVRR